MNRNAPIRDLDPSLLRAFVSIVDAGTFARAAARLNRTQSALSMQVKRLEDVVDATLFDRNNRPPTLTIAGEKLLAYAREIVAVNDAALESLRSDKLSGRVRLGLMEDFATFHLPRMLSKFRRLFPDVLIEVETGLTSEFKEMVGARFDAVIVMTPENGTEGEFLYRGKPLWGGAPGVDPVEHEVLHLALYRPGCFFRKWATEALDKAERRWHAQLIANSIGAVAAEVREGGCVSVFKDLTWPGGLCRLGCADGLPDLPNFELRLLRAPSADRGAAKAFADFLGEEVRSLHSDLDQRPALSVVKSERF